MRDYNWEGNGMRQKGKKKTRSYILLTVFMFVVMACSVFCVATYYVGRMHAEYKAGLDANDKLIQQNTRLVYVAARNIRLGEKISEEMLELRRTLCSQEGELLFSQQDIGKEAVVDIEAGTFLNKAFVNQSGEVDGLREICYRTIALTENVKNYDVVDIRIRYPDGEDYIILSGKRILIEEEGYGSCYLRVSEEEILLMSAAMVDAEQRDGTTIYASRYLEPGIQKKSFVTYRPSAEIQGLIEKSPNIEIKVMGEQSEE